MSSKRKHKLEPISLQELADTPGMSGFCTFLTRRPDGQAPAGTGPPTAAADNTSEQPQYHPATHAIYDPPIGESPMCDLPVGDQPVGKFRAAASLMSAQAISESGGESPIGHTPVGDSRIAELLIGKHEPGSEDQAERQSPVGESPIGESRTGNPPIGSVLATSLPLGPRDPIALPILLPVQNDQPPFELPSSSLQTLAIAPAGDSPGCKSPVGNPPIGKSLRPATRVEGNNQARVRRATLAQPLTPTPKTRFMT